MATGSSNQQGLTRREFVFTGGAAVAGLAVGGGVGYALAPKEEGAAATSEEPIKVGGAYPLTGYSAADGDEMLQGLQLGVEEINNGGGVLGRELVIESADIESELAADKISNVFQRLISEKDVSVICMGYCDYTNASWKVIADAGLPVMHTNAYSGNTAFVAEDLETYGMVFQATPNEGVYGSGFAEFLKGIQDSGAFKPRKKTAAILTSTDPYSVNIARTFKEAIQKEGWKIVVDEEFTAPLSEYGPMLAKVRNTDPDMVFNADWLVNDLASFTKQFRAGPTQSLLYEQYGPAVPEYLKLTGDSSNGVLWSTNIGILPDEWGEAQKEAYRTKFGEEPGLTQAGLQRDMLYMWANAVGLAGDPSDYPTVVAHMQKGIMRGTCGAYRYFPTDLSLYSYPADTPDPSMGMPLLTYQIRAGAHQLINPQPYGQAEFELPPWMG